MYPCSPTCDSISASSQSHAIRMVCSDVSVCSVTSPIGEMVADVLVNGTLQYSTVGASRTLSDFSSKELLNHLDEVAWAEIQSYECSRILHHALTYKLLTSLRS